MWCWLSNSLQKGSLQVLHETLEVRQEGTCTVLFPATERKEDVVSLRCSLWHLQNEDGPARYCIVPQQVVESRGLHCNAGSLSESPSGVLLLQFLSCIKD
jgi:hypothetical protein